LRQGLKSSVQEEERLGWDRVANLFRVRHRQLDPFSKSCVQLGSDIRITFASEFANIAVFDNSPISYLQPELHTAVDPGIIEKDKTYYHVYIILSVENTLFKLPRCMLEEGSKIFQDMFLLPSPDDASCDGSSDEQPLFLHGVRKAAFRRLLMAMEQPGEDVGYEDYDSETARILFLEWVSVLDLSCMWQMAEVRQRATKDILKLLDQVGQKDLIYLLTLSDKLGISEIRDRFIECLSKSLEPVKLIQLGIELPMYSLLVNGYARLVMQEDGISTEHEELLGMKTTSKLFRIRDKYLQERGRYYFNRGSVSVIAEVELLFAEELKETLWK